MSTTPATDMPVLTFDGRIPVPAGVFSLQRFREWVHSDRQFDRLGEFEYRLLAR
ncbi:MAG TPA: hypothetical protein VMV69_24785 [Pirellulales bacterium]|nr:hypothetical protein [Pirellulales bacterium]